MYCAVVNVVLRLFIHSAYLSRSRRTSVSTTALLYHSPLFAALSIIQSYKYWAAAAGTNSATDSRLSTALSSGYRPHSAFEFQNRRAPCCLSTLFKTSTNHRSDSMKKPRSNFKQANKKVDFASGSPRGRSPITRFSAFILSSSVCLMRSRTWFLKFLSN